jgi:hypothetical protein
MCLSSWGVPRPYLGPESVVRPTRQQPRDPAGAEDYVTPCDLRILMDESAEPITPEQGAWSFRGWIGAGDGGALVEGPVRVVGIVVIDVFVEDEPQMPFASDQHPVQAFAADAADPPFGDCILAVTLGRCLDDPDACGGEHSIETPR